MTNDVYMIAITALLPLMAVLLVLQVNPYQALVIRGILGAIAALVYALYGAADVALTEALVGTMLSITLYAIAVRSSMVVRVGVVESSVAEAGSIETVAVVDVLSALKKAFNKYHMRTELVSYPDVPTLTSALERKEIHTACEPSGLLKTRLKRLHEILLSGLPSAMQVTYFDLT